MVTFILVNITSIQTQKISLKNKLYTPIHFLFDDTIKNNIIFNDIENFDDDKFQFSIRISKLENLLDRLPDRENTNIGEIGKKISGERNKNWNCSCSI